MRGRPQSDETTIRAEWLSHIAEQVGEGMAVANLRGRLIFVNQAWARMHGYSIPELIGRNLSIGHSPQQMRQDVIPFNQKVMRYGKWSGRVGHIRRDGTPFMTEMTTTILRDRHRQPVGLIGFAKDISDRIRAEQAQQALEKSLDMFRLCHQALAQGRDEPGILQEVCDIIVGRGGYFQARVGLIEAGDRNSYRMLAHRGPIPQNWLPGRTRSWRKTPTARALRTGKPVCQQNITGSLGDRLPATEAGSLSWLACPLRHQGQVYGVIDVLSRRPEGFIPQEREWLSQLANLIGQGLIAHRQKLWQNLFFKDLPYQFLLLDNAGRLLEHRGENLGFPGSCLDRLLGKNLSRALPPYISQPWNKALSDALRTGRPQIVEYSLSEGGRERHCQARLSPLGRQRVAVWVNDITRRRKSEEENSRYRQQYQILTDISPVGIFQTRPDGYTTYVNQEWCRIAVLPSHQALGNGWFKAVHPEDRKRIQAGWRRALSQRSPSSTLYRFLHRNGQVRWVIGQARPVRDLRDRITGYLGTITDITALKMAEEELRACANFNQAIIDRCPIGIAVHDGRGRLLAYNQAWQKIWALPRSMIEEMQQEMTPDRLRRIYWYIPEHLPAVIEIFQKGGSYNITDIHFPRRRPGQAEWINQYFYSIPDARGRVDKIVVMVEDITQRQRAEQKVWLLSRKMSPSSGDLEAATRNSGP